MSPCSTNRRPNFPKTSSWRYREVYCIFLCSLLLFTVDSQFWQEQFPPARSENWCGYAHTNLLSLGQIADMVVVSIGGGFRDSMIVPRLTMVRGIVAPSRGFAVLTSEVVKAHSARSKREVDTTKVFSTDHQASAHARARLSVRLSCGILTLRLFTCYVCIPHSMSSP